MGKTPKAKDRLRTLLSSSCKCAHGQCFQQYSMGPVKSFMDTFQSCTKREQDSILFMACSNLEGSQPHQRQTRRSYYFLGQHIRRQCFEALLGVGSHRIDRIGSLDMRFKDTKKPPKPSPLTASVDSFLLVLYGSVAEPLPDKSLDLVLQSLFCVSSVRAPCMSASIVHKAYTLFLFVRLETAKVCAPECHEGNWREAIQTCESWKGRKLGYWPVAWWCHYWFRRWPHRRGSGWIPTIHCFICLQHHTDCCVHRCLSNVGNFIENIQPLCPPKVCPTHVWSSACTHPAKQTQGYEVPSTEVSSSWQCLWALSILLLLVWCPQCRCLRIEPCHHSVGLVFYSLILNRCHAELY